MRDDYSIDCEKCGKYNFSPVFCKDCFKREIIKILEEEKLCYLYENCCFELHLDRILERIKENE